MGYKIRKPLARVPAFDYFTRYLLNVRRFCRDAWRSQELARTRNLIWERNLMTVLGLIPAGALVATILTLTGNAAPAAFQHVTMRSTLTPESQIVVDRDVDLILDDEAATVNVETHRLGARMNRGEVIPAPFAVSYEDIARVILETTIRPNGTIAHWFYFERKPGATPARFLLMAGNDNGVAIAAQIRKAFGARAVEPEFQQARSVPAIALPKPECRYAAVRAPLPQARPDRALVVVVSPRTGASAGTTTRWSAPVLIDGREQGVNDEATYVFAYVEPGEHVVASQKGRQSSQGNRPEMADAISQRMEAGKSYYFSQDPEQGRLFMRSPETASFEAMEGRVLAQRCARDVAPDGQRTVSQSPQMTQTENVAAKAENSANFRPAPKPPRPPFHMKATGLEFSGYYGQMTTNGPLNNLWPAVGGGVTLNTNSPLQLFGEASFFKTSYSEVKRHVINFGGGPAIQFRFGGPRMNVYVFGIFGGASGFFSSPSLGQQRGSTFYVGPGLGVRYFIGRNWGIRPEVRLHYYSDPRFAHLGVYSLGAFYVIGGERNRR